MFSQLIDQLVNTKHVPPRRRAKSSAINATHARKVYVSNAHATRNERIKAAMEGRGWMTVALVAKLTHQARQNARAQLKLMIADGLVKKAGEKPATYLWIGP